jgi:hypothetical protein
MGTIQIARNTAYTLVNGATGTGTTNSVTFIKGSANSTDNYGVLQAQAIPTGTFSALAFHLELSSDGGTTWGIVSTWDAVASPVITLQISDPAVNLSTGFPIEYRLNCTTFTGGTSVTVNGWIAPNPPTVVMQGTATNVNASQSGAWNVGIIGSGNSAAVTTSNALKVDGSAVTQPTEDAADGTPGSAVPSLAQQIAGSDGTDLRTILTSSTGQVHCIVDSGGGSPNVTIIGPLDGSGNVKTAVENTVSVTNTGTFATQDSNLSTTISGGKVSVQDTTAEGYLQTLASTVGTSGASGAPSKLVAVGAYDTANGDFVGIENTTLGGVNALITYTVDDSGNQLFVSGNPAYVQDTTAEGYLATLAGAVSGGLNQENQADWGGQAVTAATTAAPVGTEAAPVVRSITRKQSSVLTTTSLGANAAYTSSWVDTTQTGDAYVEISAFANQTGASMVLQGTDDTSNSNFTQTLTLNVNGNGGQTITANTLTTIAANITTRYWRVVYTNSSTAQTSFELTATTNSMTNPWSMSAYNVKPTTTQFSPQVVQQIGSDLCFGLLTAAMASGGTALTDGTGNNAANGGVNAGVGSLTNSYQATFPYLFNGTSWDRQRTPNLFRGGQINSTNAGAVNIWQPQVGKKAQMLRYQVEVSGSATLGSAGDANIAFAFGNGIITANTQGIDNTPTYNHTVYIPSTAADSLGSYCSGWIDLGNGLISSVANQPLYVGLQLPQSTSAVNPTWTISSQQWEAITIGFKTLNNRGNFQLVQQTNAVAATTTVSVTPSTLPGSLVVLLVHSTNSATGTPVFSISANTAGDTYTATTTQTNASDGAHGGTLGILYTASSKGANTNTITVSATNSPTELSVIYLEYQNTNGLDASAVGTTGNSTSPASGNYTPATAGDLIISTFGTCANIAAVPTVGSSFFVRGAIFNATQGSLAVADNFGNGALASGTINVVTVGVEN